MVEFAEINVQLASSDGELQRDANRRLRLGADELDARKTDIQAWLHTSRHVQSVVEECQFKLPRTKRNIDLTPTKKP